MFPAERDVDEAGQTVALRIVLGTEDQQAAMDAINPQ
jgi:hypothetical protein